MSELTDFITLSFILFTYHLVYASARATFTVLRVSRVCFTWGGGEFKGSE